MRFLYRYTQGAIARRAKIAAFDRVLSTAAIAAASAISATSAASNASILAGSPVGRALAINLRQLRVHTTTRVHRHSAVPCNRRTGARRLSTSGECSLRSNRVAELPSPAAHAPTTADPLGPSDKNAGSQLMYTCIKTKTNGIIIAVFSRRLTLMTYSGSKFERNRIYLFKKIVYGCEQKRNY